VSGQRENDEGKGRSPHLLERRFKGEPSKVLLLDLAEDQKDPEEDQKDLEED